MTTSRRTFNSALAATLASASLPRAFAQAGAVKLAVGASAGGTTDVVARALAQFMGKELGEPVVVENKAGAAGNIAAQYVAVAPPDGKTLLVSYTSFSINASLYKKLPFDPLKDFTPISLLATLPGVLAVRSDFPANTVAELIALAKAKPGHYAAALGGLGSSVHLATSSLRMMAGIDVIEVPFQGSAPAVTALLGGQVHMMFNSTQNVAQHVKAGTLKVLGVTSTKPIKSFPGVAPIADTVKGFESYSWYGLFGPAKLPARTVAAYNAVARKLATTPEFRQLLESDSGEAASTSPEEFDAFVRRDIERYAVVVKATGATVN